MPTARDLTVLVVDDQQSMRAMARLGLNQLGITRIGEAADAANALVKLQQMRFDLVICDWIMADMDGLALVGRIRAHPVLKNTPFIMASARQASTQVASAGQAGVNAYLVKPLTAPELKATIEKILGPLT
jgi:two-component system chemotaxis response regulator CheY